MKVKDIMTKKIISVDPDCAIDKVARILTENRIHTVPVLDNKKLVGVVTQSDFFIKGSLSFHLPSYIGFIEKVGAPKSISDNKNEKIKQLLNIKAKDIMTEKVLTFLPQTDIAGAVKVFQETSINSFPVVDEEDKLVGIITLYDVLQLI